jgi:NTE family protein
MFGAYQAGAYKALAAWMKPDMIVGASVGAMNGWPIAGGCAPEELIERWLDPATGTALSFLPNAGWRNGWLDPAQLRAQAEQICGLYTPRIPLGVVVVQLAGLRAQLVRYPDIGPEHLHASCTIPVFLPMVKINGRRYMDGGILENLPVWAALEMGATRIIAVDSLPRAENLWLRLGIRMAEAFKPRRYFPEDLDLTVISPSEPMGNARDAVLWKRENIERWVDLGMRDASFTAKRHPLQ